MNSKKLWSSLLLGFGMFSLVMTGCVKKNPAQTSSSSSTTSSGSENSDTGSTNTDSSSTSSGPVIVDLKEKSFDVGYYNWDGRDDEISVWTDFPIDDGVLVSEAPVITAETSFSEKESAIGRHTIKLDNNHRFTLVVDNQGYLIMATFGGNGGAGASAGLCGDGTGYGNAGDFVQGSGTTGYANVVAYSGANFPCFITAPDWGPYPAKTLTKYDFVIPEGGFVVTAHVDVQDFYGLYAKLFNNDVLVTPGVKNEHISKIPFGSLDKWYLSLNEDKGITVRLRTEEEVRVFDEEAQEYYQEKDTFAIQCQKEEKVTEFAKLADVVAEANAEKEYLVKGIITSDYKENGLVIQDDSGEIMVYDASAEKSFIESDSVYQVGQTVLVKGKYVNDAGLLELVPSEPLKVVTKNGKVKTARVEELTAENFVAANVNKYVKLAKAEVKSLDKDGVSVLKVDETEYKVVNIVFEENEIKVGDVIDLTAVIALDETGAPVLRNTLESEVARYTLVKASANNENAAITGAGAYKSGDEVELVAGLVDTYVFLGWYEVEYDEEGALVDEKFVSADRRYTFVVAQDVELVAKYAYSPMEADSNPVLGELDVEGRNTASDLSVWVEEGSPNSVVDETRKTTTHFNDDLLLSANVYTFEVIVDKDGKIAFAVVNLQNGYGRPWGQGYYRHPDYEDWKTNPAFVFAEDFDFDAHTGDWERVIPEGGFYITAESSEDGKASSLLMSLLTDGNITAVTGAMGRSFNAVDTIDASKRVYFDRENNKLIVKGNKYVDVAFVGTELLKVNDADYVEGTQLKVGDELEIGSTVENFLKWSVDGVDMVSRTDKGPLVNGNPSTYHLKLTVTEDLHEVKAIARSADNSQGEFDALYNYDGYAYSLGVWTDDVRNGTQAPLLEGAGASGKLTGTERSAWTNLANSSRWAISVDAEGYIVFMGYGPGTGYASPADTYYESSIKDPERKYANATWVLGDDFAAWPNPGFTHYDAIIPAGGFVITGHDSMPELAALMGYLKNADHAPLETVPVADDQNGFCSSIAKGALDKYVVSLDGDKIVITERDMSVEHTVTVSGGTVNVKDGEPAATVTATLGTLVTITPELNNGKLIFDHWADENGNVVYTTSTYTFGLGKDMNLVAVTHPYVYPGEADPVPENNTSELKVSTENTGGSDLAVYYGDAAPVSTLDATKHTSSRYTPDVRFPEGRWKFEVVVDSEGKVAYMIVNAVNAWLGNASNPWGVKYYAHPDYDDWKTNPAFAFAEGFNKENPSDTTNAYQAVIPEGGFYVLASGEGAHSLISMLTRGRITAAGDDTMAVINNRTSLDSRVRVHYDSETKMITVVQPDALVPYNVGNYSIFTEETEGTAKSYIDDTRVAVVNPADPNQKYWVDGSLENNGLFVAVDSEGRIAYLAAAPSNASSGTAYSSSYYRNSYYECNFVATGGAEGGVHDPAHEKEGRVNPALVVDETSELSWSYHSRWQLVVPQGGFVIVANRGKAFQELVDAIYGKELLENFATNPYGIYDANGILRKDIALELDRQYAKYDISDDLRIRLSEDKKSYVIENGKVNVPTVDVEFKDCTVSKLNGADYVAGTALKVGDEIEVVANDSTNYLKWKVNGEDRAPRLYGQKFDGISTGKQVYINNKTMALAVTVTEDLATVEVVNGTADNSQGEFNALYNYCGHDVSLSVWTDDVVNGTQAPLYVGSETLRSSRENLGTNYRWSIAVDSEGYIAWMNYVDKEERYVSLVSSAASNIVANEVIPTGGFTITGFAANAELKALLGYLANADHAPVADATISPDTEGATAAFLASMESGALDNYKLSLNGDKIVVETRTEPDPVIEEKVSYSGTKSGELVWNEEKGVFEGNVELSTWNHIIFTYVDVEGNSHVVTGPYAQLEGLFVANIATNYACDWTEKFYCDGAENYAAGKFHTFCGGNGKSVVYHFEFNPETKTLNASLYVEPVVEPDPVNYTINVVDFEIAADTAQTSYKERSATYDDLTISSNKAAINTTPTWDGAKYLVVKDTGAYYEFSSEKEMTKVVIDYKRWNTDSALTGKFEYFDEAANEWKAASEELTTLATEASVAGTLETSVEFSAKKVRFSFSSTTGKRIGLVGVTVTYK